MLIALAAGEDVLRFEPLSDQVIMAKAMAVLRSIFGDTAVPEVGVHLHTFNLSVLCRTFKIMG